MKSSNKKIPKQLQQDIIQDDEFDLQSQNQKKKGKQMKDKKSIANIYEELLNKKKSQVKNKQQQQKIQSKKQKKKQKQKIKKQNLKQQVQVKKQKKQAEKNKQKKSSSMKFINNKALEDELKKTTLMGVTKIFNLIVNHKKQIQS